MNLDLNSDEDKSINKLSVEIDKEEEGTPNPFRQCAEENKVLYDESSRNLKVNLSSPAPIGFSKNSFEQYGKTKNINQKYKEQAELSQYSRRDNRFLKTIISQQEYETSDDGKDSMKKNKMQKSNSQTPSLGFLSDGSTRFTNGVTFNFDTYFVGTIAHRTYVKFDTEFLF